MTAFAVGDRIMVTESVSTYVPGRLDAVTVHAGAIGEVLAIDPSFPYPYRVVVDDPSGFNLGDAVVLNLCERLMWGPVA
jgi:hypothetical protein